MEIKENFLNLKPVNSFKVLLHNRLKIDMLLVYFYL